MILVPFLYKTSAALDTLVTDSSSIIADADMADIPSFTFTPAGTSEDTGDTRTPLQPESESYGPTRCHGSVFLDKLYNINSEDQPSH